MHPGFTPAKRTSKTYEVSSLRQHYPDQELEIARRSYGRRPLSSQALQSVGFLAHLVGQFQYSPEATRPH